MTGQNQGTFAAQWNTWFGSTPPLGRRLRKRFSSRWLRVLSLPDGKKYAEDEEERDVLLMRSNALGSELLGVEGQCWLVAARFELDAPGVIPEYPDVVLRPALTAEPDEELETRTVFYAAPVTWRSGAFDDLLMAVAEDRRRVLWVNATTGEVLAPYEGGVDVITQDATRREVLRARFGRWLPRR